MTEAGAASPVRPATPPLPPLPPPAPRRATPWFGITGLLLLATLLAAAFMQVRQHALLNLTVKYQDDYLVLSIYQLESEYLRLREQWRAAATTPGTQQAALQLRYDIFLSRVGLLRTDRATRLIGDSDDTQRALRGIDGFAARADLYLGAEPRGPLSAQAAQALLPELDALAEPIHQMLLDATHRVALQSTERQAQVRQHNLIGLGLTGFLSAMVLVFATISMRQLRKAEQRRSALEALADQLRDARIEAEAASAAKSEFLADMSHELRTPLHGLLGMLALLREAPRDVQAGEWLRTADDSATHLLRLLDDMLDLSKLEAGTLELSPQPVSPRALLHEVQALMQPQALAKGLQLRCELDDALPPWLLLDPTRARQVLFNLLNNAIKFSDAGQVVLRCRHGGGTPPTLQFDVSDTGIGIEPDTVARLFRRFARGDDPAARRHAGTGLGLAISRNLARLMGGEIVVHSTPGAGSVFSFRCPLQPAAAPAAATVAATVQTPRPLRVLVAEDHPVNRLYVAALLERLGHQGHLVENGLEAVQAMRDQTFDLVLMDVHMPVMDGAAAAQAIRALPAPAGTTRIVALTADVFPDTRERCLGAGIDEVVTKPVSLQSMTTLLGRTPVTPIAPAAEAGADDAAPPLIDLEAVAGVRELMGGPGTPSLYASLFEQAIDAARRMREAMRDADTEALRRAAHAVKGAALNLGLPALAAAATALHRDAATLGAAQLALAVQRFEELVGATRALCRDEGLLGPEA